MPKETKSEITRREFLTSTAALGATALAASLTSTNFAFAASTDTIRVGLIGCGGRGSGAAGNCLASSQNIELVALGDLFEDRVNGARDNLKGLGAGYKVTPDKCFTGFDAYKKVLAADVDMVILATPPGFRPIHLAAAIEAGKHVFMEKPVAVDPTGIRSVIASAQKAKQKGLGLVAGTQRRHQLGYVEVMKRVNDGAIGDIVSGQCYWNQGGLWAHERGQDETDVEWQIRNWLYFAWLSGDHIVEQHVHNLDVIQWAMKDVPPTRVVGMGGRQSRVQPVYGHIFDHFALDIEYPNGAHVMSMCRQIDGCENNVSERIEGTKGGSNCGGSIWGETTYNAPGGGKDAYVQEHTDLIASIRSGQPLNEGERIAHSTMVAIMGRMSAYTGKAVTWDMAMNSKLDLMPKDLKFGPMAVAEVAVPGKTQFV
ncbi:MAG TPA: Gfo/Idh/MocA family oxidoreductase [Armatimonadota bacterium]|jgi:predicted dehydrogenase